MDNRVVLCLDWGNSYQKYAIFKNNQLIHKDYLPDISLPIIQQVVLTWKVTHSILASVMQRYIEIEDYLKNIGYFHLLQGASSKLTFHCVRNKETIGADILALVSGAVATQKVHLLQHTLIISAGSAITYSYINRDRELISANISPGIRLRLRSLHDHCYLLPSLPHQDKCFTLFGYDTKTAIYAGVYGGIIYEIEGMIKQYRDRYDQLIVYLTGGDSDFLASYIKSPIFVDTNLLFKGLHALLKYNEI